MQVTRHAGQRMNQRGISRRLVEFTMRHGRIEGDRRVLDRQESRRLIEMLTEELRLAKRVMDKGGVVVVDSERDSIVTAYNVDTPMRGRRRTCGVSVKVTDMVTIQTATRTDSQAQVQGV